MKRITVTAAALLAMTFAASAKDKMEKVDIVKDGIDLQTITVRSSGNGYVGASQASYDFSVRGYAKAKKGYRLLKVWFHTGKLDEGHVEAPFGRDYGNGHNRTVSLSRSYKVPMGKLVWADKSPVEACNANLEKLRQSGFSRHEILSKNFEMKLDAVVGFSAVADREGRQPSPIGLGGGSTWETKTMRYPVQVKCMALPARKS